MQETELHDLSDDADYAASLQQGPRSSAQGGAGKLSVSIDPAVAEVVYVKENVTIHPTQYASQRISGRLRLIKQGSSLFMTWIPYRTRNTDPVGQSSSTSLSEKDRNLYTIRAVPLTDVRSIRRHTPTLGWQYMIVVLTSGLAFPPLYFYSGGVREFLATLKEHILLVRSADDANVFLVNDLEDPLQRSLSSLELPRAVSFSNGTSSSIAPSAIPSNETAEKIHGDGHDAAVSEYSGRHRHKAHDPARDLSIQVLEKFSLVTKFARETTTQLFRDNHNDGLGTYDRKHQIHSVPAKAPGNSADATQKTKDVIPALSDSLEQKTITRKEKLDEEAATRVGNFELIDCKEFDRLSLVWGKPRQPPLGFEEWATFFDSEGRIMDSKALRKRIFYGGVEHCLRKEVWKFLLGFHEYDSTYAEREYLISVKKAEYETIKLQWQSISAAQAKRFTKFRERKGLIDKDVVRTDRSISFYDGDDNPNVKLLRDILLTYSFYNFDLGYCQKVVITIVLKNRLPRLNWVDLKQQLLDPVSGMSDLLSPILFVMENESDSFWCFVGMMERLGPNFNRDQNGMHAQLFALSKLVELLDIPLHNYLKQADCLNYFFCFRWILIQFKREFEFEKIMLLWEVLWTHYLSEHFHLYICVAILKRYRKKIIGEQMDFDTLLKFINELSGQIEIDGTLRDAEALCICAGENGAACIPPGTPPSLPLESDLINTHQEDEVL